MTDYRLLQTGDRRLDQDGTSLRILEGSIGSPTRIATVSHHTTGPTPDVRAHALITGRLEKLSSAPARTQAIYLPGGGGLETSFQSGTDTNPNVGGNVLRDAVGRWKRRRAVTIPTDWTWGIDAMSDSIDAMLTYAEANYGFSPPYHLILASMGVVCGLNWAKNNLDRVAAIAALIPMLDIQAAVDDGRFAPYPPPTIYPPDDPVAYGTRPPNDHTPARFASTFIGTPMTLWYSNNDTVAKPAEAAAFATAAGATGVNCGNQTGFVGIPGHNLGAGAGSTFRTTDVGDFLVAND